MPWEYLSTDALDCRFLYVAGYLQVRNLIAGKRLVDLNCGSARLLRYLPQTFEEYTANDIHQRPDSTAPRLRFLPLPDTDMPAQLWGRAIDVLMVFGLADAGRCQSPWESATTSETFLALVQSHAPDTLIVECSAAYDAAYGVAAPLLGALERYAIESDVTVMPTGSDGHAVRRIIVLRPRPVPYHIARRPIEAIHAYYLRRARECVAGYRQPRVLKTDACNESHENLPLPGGIALNLPADARVTLVEYDPQVIDAARARHPGLDIRQGDICELAGFADESCDVVLDLSTLDHVRPKYVPAALAAYRRVLKSAGTLLLVFWGSLDPRLVAEGDVGEGNHGPQYYFDIDRVRDTLRAVGFELITEDHVFVDGPHILDCIRCTRR